MTEPEVKITVPLDADVHAALSAAAKQEGRAVGRQAAALLAKMLPALRKSKSKIKTRPTATV